MRISGFGVTLAVATLLVALAGLTGLGPVWGYDPSRQSLHPDTAGGTWASMLADGAVVQAGPQLREASSTYRLRSFRALHAAFPVMVAAALLLTRRLPREAGQERPVVFARRRRLPSRAPPALRPA